MGDQPLLIEATHQLRHGIVGLVARRLSSRLISLARGYCQEQLRPSYMARWFASRSPNLLEDLAELEKLVRLYFLPP